MSEKDPTAAAKSAPRALPFFALIAVVFVSRVPFLDAGYGDDGDAWRVVAAARKIAESGSYQVSRFPGYPVQEIACAFFAHAGPVAMNGLTAVMSCVAVGFFYLSARKMGCCLPLLVSLAFASTPVIYIHSTTAMDYMWALGFVMAALYAALCQRPLVAGALLGLAIGCRITAGAMIVPLGILVAWGGEPGGRYRRLTTFVASTLAVGGLMFVPVFAKYGCSFFTYYDTVIRWHKVPRMATEEVWGRLGLLGLALAVGGMCWLAWRNFRERNATMPRAARILLLACLIAVLLYLIAFFRLPVDAGYLVPVVPFVLLILTRISPRPAIAVMCLLLILSPFVSVGRQGIKAGRLLADRRERLEDIKMVRGLRHAADQLEPRLIVIAGASIYWMEGLYLADDPQRRFVYSMDPVEAARYRADGYRLYYTPAGRREAAKHGGDVDRYGALPLPGTEE